MDPERLAVHVNEDTIACDIQDLGPAFFACKKLQIWFEIQAADGTSQACGVILWSQILQLPEIQASLPQRNDTWKTPLLKLKG